MKWPMSLTVIRHGQSAYNVLRNQKAVDPEYQAFLTLFNQDPTAPETIRLATMLRGRYGGKVSDYETPMTDQGHRQAQLVGGSILEYVERPDIVFVSPYLRTRQTYHGLCTGDPRISDTPMVIDDRIREQEHGLQLLYGDWRIFQALNPEQKALYDLQGPYWYQHPQGESVSMVRERIRSMLSMLVREYPGAHVWLVSHHLTKLSIRANLERLTPEQFVHIDRHDKPVNCGVTSYRGRPDLGRNGRLELGHYNLKLYA